MSRPQPAIHARLLSRNLRSMTSWLPCSPTTTDRRVVRKVHRAIGRPLAEPRIADPKVAAMLIVAQSRGMAATVAALRVIVHVMKVRAPARAAWEVVDSAEASAVEDSAPAVASQADA